MPYKKVCGKCGAIRIDQQIGLEATYQEHIEKLVVLFRELRRALHPMGTLWLNYGDCYATKPSGDAQKMLDRPENKDGRVRRPTDDRTFTPKPFSTIQGNLKPKDLVGMAWRLALALQDDGWILRSDIIWHKPNPMPESVQDRPTKAHEYVFLFAKSPRYFYDIESVREKTGNEMTWEEYNKATSPGNSWPSGGISNNAGAHKPDLRRAYPSGRNKRTVWTVATEPYSEAHFATFPQKLIEPMILAGTSARGVCPECGNPWERVTEPTPEYAQHLNKDWADYGQDDTEGRGHFERNGTKAGQRPTKRSEASITASYVTTGWRPTCDHYNRFYLSDFPRARNPRKRHQRDVTGNWWKRTRRRPGLDRWPANPAVVLDPFFGSGTVGKVATKHRRNWLGFELNPDYIEMSYNRINNTQLAMEF